MVSNSRLSGTDELRLKNVTISDYFICPTPRRAPNLARGGHETEPSCLLIYILSKQTDRQFSRSTYDIDNLRSDNLIFLVSHHTALVVGGCRQRSLPRVVSSWHYRCHNPNFDCFELDPAYRTWKAHQKVRAGWSLG